MRDFKDSWFKLSVTVFLHILCGPAILLAQDQQIKFEHLGTAQGLSQSSVYCILQDQQGFLWFGTQEGLNKYDGYNFTVYKQNVFDSTSLPFNVVLSICEDHTGTLWVGTWGGGLCKFDREKENFVRFSHAPKNPHSLSNNKVFKIYEDYASALWVGTDYGLNKFDREKEQFIRFTHDPENPRSLIDDRVTSICEDSSGALWIGTRGGLSCLTRADREQGRFTNFVNDPENPKSLSHNDVASIFVDHFGILWIGTHGGLNKFESAKEQFVRFVNDPNDLYSISSDTIHSIHEDHLGGLWLGTWGGGANLFDRDKEKFTRFLHDAKNPFSFSDNVVWTIYRDRSDILWFGTFFGGINKYDRGKERFTQFVHDPNNPNSLSHNQTTSFYQDHAGTLWVGTNGGGLNRFDRDTKKFTHFVHDANNPHSLSENRVLSVLGDHLGKLWVGTSGGGVNRFDYKTKQFVHFAHDPGNPHTISTNEIYTLCEDSSGAIWVGTFAAGLNRFDRENKQFTRFVHDPMNLYSISNDTVLAMRVDRSGKLWVGTWGGGLNRFDPDTELFTRYIHDPRNPHSLSHHSVVSLCEDHKGNIWVGTWGGGLNQLNRETGQFSYFTTEDGLPDNSIWAISQDDYGRLWLGTVKGIVCFYPETRAVRKYDISDGLADDECGQGFYKNDRGEIFQGGPSGFTMFHPDSIKDNPYVPPVVVTSFKRYNTDDASGIAIEEKGISARKEIAVSYKDNVLTIEFAALSYRNTLKNQYAYKLEGFNDNWIQLGKKRDVTFTNLDPGEYTLRVKGSNNDGVWNEEGTLLKITITPPWWQTRWAYAFYVSLFMLSLYGWRRFELNRVKLRNELKMKNFEAQKLQEMDQMKSRFFANISHEFRTPLTLILGPVEQIRAGEFKGNLQEACDMILRNGQRLLRLINQLLDLARIEAGRMSLQARPENIVSFLKGLVLSFVSAAERKRINLIVSAPEENLIVYFDRDKLEKIISNLLSNALKFTPEEGSISVAVRRGSGRGERPFAPTPEYVEISVADTGPGMPPDQRDKIFDRFYQVDASQTREHEGTGIGLALTKELVELHHGEIVVQSEVGQGTTFVVRLPLGKAHLKPEEVASDQLAVTSDQLAMTSDQASTKWQVASGKDSDFPLIQRSTTPSIQEPPSSDDSIVLVVEDNRDVRAYIRQYLEPAFKVVEAVDGVAGVEKALEIIPDLIISDVMMPKRDGNELCRILKTDEKTSHVPIIMLTAKADRDSKVQGLETGADDYLIKPFDSRELLARVHNLIRQRQQLRERFSREIVLKPQDIAITPRDEVFLNKVKAVVEKHLDDEDFEVEELGQQVGMSRSQLHRKLRALTDQTPSQFIRSMRLARAVELLKQDAATVAEIAYQVGFGSQAYFTKCFHEQFGCSPKAYVKRNPPNEPPLAQ